MKQCVWVALCLALLSVLGCRQHGAKYGSPILSADTMKSVLLDVLKANAYNDTRRFKDSNYLHDSAYATLYESIFVSHHITREEFYDSYDYYIARPDEFRAMIDSMAAKASRDMARQGMGPANPRPNGSMTRPGIHPTFPPGRQIGPDGRPLPPGGRPPFPGQAPPGGRPPLPGQAKPGSPPANQPPGKPPANQ